jgi:hypothetical protein
MPPARENRTATRRAPRSPRDESPTLFTRASSGGVLPRSTAKTDTSGHRHGNRP